MAVPPVPKLIAHRGEALRYPENSLPAIAAALQAGARYIEIDVQMSADGVPVLFHDADLQRLCAAPGAIADYRLSQLNRLRAWEPERFGERFRDVRIPTLVAAAALMVAWPQASLFVEVKIEAFAAFDRETVFRRVAAALAPIGARAVLVSFDLAFLRTAKGRGWPAVGLVRESWAALLEPAVPTLAPDYLFTDVEHLPAARGLARPGARLAVYEVADAQRALDLAARGCELIETFTYAETSRALAAALRACPSASSP
jgi:glycerophosphoryl diester phosphodiesterase